jgi:[acyl-carrier-protein] S-malonyltransferase
MSVAYVFPGQGAQRVGMGRDLYENFSSAKAVFKEADEALNFPLSRLCFEGPEDDLRQTVNTQPAIVMVSLACLKALEEVDTDKTLPVPAFVAGHSLGEYTALAASGVIDFATAIYIARERGRLMHEAGLKMPGSMMAIIGLDQNVLADICDKTDTRIANINSPGQLVISGEVDKLARAAELAKEEGAYRVMNLSVSGAFHTPLMQPAVDGMSVILDGISFRKPAIPVIANTTGQPLTEADQVKPELLRQLCNSIDWQGSVEYMVKNGVSTFIEIGPGKVLTGLIKRIDRNVRTINFGDAAGIANMNNILAGDTEI